MIQVFSLTKQGVDEIVEGTYADAVSTLTKALKTVKLAMTGDAMVADQDSKDCGQSEVTADELHCEFTSNTPQSSFLRTCENGTRICKSSIFRDPINITGNVEGRVPDLGVFERLSYVILYNLALAYHLRAIEERESRLQTLNLQKALALYEHAKAFCRFKICSLDSLSSMALK